MEGGDWDTVTHDGYSMCWECGVKRGERGERRRDERDTGIASCSSIYWNQNNWRTNRRHTDDRKWEYGKWLVERKRFRETPREISQISNTKRKKDRPKQRSLLIDHDLFVSSDTSTITHLGRYTEKVWMDLTSVTLSLEIKLFTQQVYNIQNCNNHNRLRSNHINNNELHMKDE